MDNTTKVFDTEKYVIFIQHNLNSSLFKNPFEPKLTAITLSTDVDVKPVYQIGTYNVKGFSFGGMLITGEIYALQNASKEHNFDLFLDQMATTVINREIDFVNQQPFTFKIFSANIFRNSFDTSELYIQDIENVRVYNRTESKDANSDQKVLRYSFVQERQIRRQIDINENETVVDALTRNYISSVQTDYNEILNSLTGIVTDDELNRISSVIKETFPVHKKMSSVLNSDKNIVDIINKISQ